MILLLNLLPALILIIGIPLTFFLAKKQKGWYAVISLVATIFAYVLLNMATPSYMPKGTVGKVPLEQPVEPKVLPPIEDRSKQPELTAEEREARHKKLFNAVEQATTK